MEPPPLDKHLPQRLSCTTAPLPAVEKPCSNVTSNKSDQLLKSALPVDTSKQERLAFSPSALPEAPSAHLLEKNALKPCKLEQRLAQKNGRLDSSKLIRDCANEDTKLPPDRAENDRALKRNIDAQYDGKYDSSLQMVKRMRLNKIMESGTSDMSKASPSSRPILHNSLADTGELYKTCSHASAKSIDGRSEVLNSLKMPLRATRPKVPPPAPRPEKDNPTYQRDRTEILAQRVLSVNEYVREMKGPKLSRRSNDKLAKIPVPLFPGETLDHYEQQFGRWLHKRLTSVISLRFLPLKERVYRHQFALQRVNKIPSTTNSKCLHPQRRSLSPQPKQTDPPFETHEVSRSRDERVALATKSRSTFSPASKVEGRTSLDNSNAFSQTSSDSSDRTECASEHSDTHLPDASKENPAISPQAGKQVARNSAQAEGSNRNKQKAENASLHTCAHVAFEDLNTQILSRSYQATGLLDSNAFLKENLPSWAVALIGNVQRLESKVTHLQRQVDSCRCGQNKSFGSLSIDTDPVRYRKRSELTEVAGVSKHTLSANLVTARDDKPAIGKKSGAVERLQNGKDIYLNAAISLARTVQFQASEHPKKRQLMEDYDFLNKQILMNETAIEDALVYIKTLKDADKAAAKEHHSQIMELVDSINREKDKRANALAALIVCSFADDKITLLQLLEEKASRKEMSGANHDMLKTISSQIEQNDNVLETLKLQLNAQLQCTNESASHALDTEKTLRLKAVKDLSERLMKEQAAKERLEDERDDVLKRFLQDDKEIQQLVKKRLAISEAGGS